MEVYPLGYGQYIWTWNKLYWNSNYRSHPDPCDPSSLNDPGGQGHVPIWNEMLYQ